ncbi:plasminogen-like [Gigantopelta aegis]|uniref:plasminogen-like n=1 Tax=Gigantopelta aegis TaxID=1735272 RepID=UPI001B88BFA9|nr:plasminogen-like [Gigantopelta aegis]
MDYPGNNLLGSGSPLLSGAVRMDYPGKDRLGSGSPLLSGANLGKDLLEEWMSCFEWCSRHGTCAFYRPKSKVTSPLPEQHYYLKYETEDKCKSAPEPECYRYVNRRPRYTGRKVTTENGITCQRWDAQTPHKHDKIFTYLFPEDSIAAAENFCRNADNNGSPWCYTVDPKTRWQECGIQLCTV